jgi:hypothetical protein
MTDQMQVPEHIAKRIAERKANNVTSAIADALAGFSSPPRISIRGSKYRLVENGVETVVGPELDVVIVGVNPHTSKVFFANEYDPNADEVRPDCSSANGKTPDADIEFPVCASCSQCPNNVLGSKITQQGSKSKKCGDTRYIAVVPAADPKKVYSMNVSVMAMKPLRVYVQSLGNYGIIPEEVVTHLGFDDDASYPLVTFTKGNFLPEAALAEIEKIQAMPEVAAATRTDVKAAELPAPSSTPAIEAPANNVVEMEDAKPAAPAKVKARTAPKKKAADKKPAVDEPVAESNGEITELESALDNIFG